MIRHEIVYGDDLPLLLKAGLVVLVVLGVAAAIAFATFWVWWAVALISAVGREQVGLAGVLVALPVGLGLASIVHVWARR